MRKIFLLGDISKTSYLKKLKNILGLNISYTWDFHILNFPEINNDESFCIMDFEKDLIHGKQINVYLEEYKPFGFIFVSDTIDSYKSAKKLYENINDYILQNESKVLFISNNTMYNTNCLFNSCYFFESEENLSVDYCLSLEKSSDLEIIKSLEFFSKHYSSLPINIDRNQSINPQKYFIVNDDEEKEKFEAIEGKTILSLTRLKPTSYVDDSYILIKFSDGTKALINGGHTGQYSSNAIDEYVSFLHLEFF